jgi:glycolate oxidase iron-sulfur subunit
VPYGRLLEQTRGQLTRRFAGGGAARRLGEGALRAVFANRGLLHLAGDLLRAGQWSPFSALMRSKLAASALPRFATQGYAMTPPIAPRPERALEHIADRLPAGARMERRAGRLLFLPAGPPRARVAFFTSCVMEVMFPRVNQEAVRLLVLAGAEVHVPADQTCCGALHVHAGLRREAKALARRNVKAFAAGDYDAIVNDSAGCGAALRETGHLLADDPAHDAAAAFAAKTRDVSELLAQLGLPKPTARLTSLRDPARPLRVGYHDPCHLAHGQGVRNQPRLLLRQLEGVELVDLPNSDWCCGSAGIYNLTHPGMADAQLARKVDSIDAVAAEVVVASNPGCAMHMARGVAERGGGVAILHLAELLGRAYPPTRA